MTKAQIEAMYRWYLQESSRMLRTAYDAKSQNRPDLEAMYNSQSIMCVIHAGALKKAWEVTES